MENLSYLIILVLMIIHETICEINHSIHKRVSEINNKSREMYGEDRRGYSKKGFELEKLMYPRGNKHKLSAISEAWRDYYTCSAAQTDAVTGDYISQNNVVVMVFQGATATLPCKLCQEPGKVDQQTWLYAKSSAMDKFGVIQEYDRLAMRNGVMSIYNVEPGDEGVLYCRLGGGGGGLTFIEVVDHEPYTVVKPPESRGPHAVDTEVYQGIILFSQWSPWSDCSVCGKVGRRHRHGMCYVKLEQHLIANFVVDPVKANKLYTLVELDDKLIELFQTFPDGLPCRSQYMPKVMADLDVIKQRPSEIMIGMCKVPCHKRRKGNVTSQASDDDGTLVYPITPTMPKQPPLPVRATIFADFGQRVVLRCPGSTLRDVPVLWRIGTKRLVPRDVDAGSGGRVYLNCRDQLVFTRTLYSDDNLYSCWQRDNLAGTVKLLVWRGAQARWEQHVKLLMVLVVLAIALRLARRGARALQRRQSVLHPY